VFTSTFHVPSNGLCAIAIAGISNAATKDTTNRNKRAFFIAAPPFCLWLGFFRGALQTVANIHPRALTSNTSSSLRAFCVPVFFTSKRGIVACRARCCKIKPR
jgi:hypothetical protein